MSAAADIKSEIERLTATINQHKSNAGSEGSSGYSYAPPLRGRGRGGYRGGYNSFSSYNSHSSYPTYGYNPARRNNKYVRPGLEESSFASPAPTAKPSSTSGSSAIPSTNAVASTSGKIFHFLADGETHRHDTGTAPSVQQPTTVKILPDGKKEVVIGGVAFESSARSLVRKDLPKPRAPTISPTATTAPYAFVRKSGHLMSSSRTYKPKTRRGRGRGRNMTLNNTRKGWNERVAKKRKYLNKPCPQFSTTGTCNRGLTCMYQHDPQKIAICWNFLQGNCTSTAETCNLSHDPTPERTPLCVHFLNKGRCTREGCLFPHVNVGQRDGVCRDFAVLGYCEKGYDCDKQHVRECPDFAENGTCSTKGCKLPHVIRANRGRKVAAAATAGDSKTLGDASSGLPPGVYTDLQPSLPEEGTKLFAEDAHMGDEFISLTFHESDSEEESEEDDEDEEGEEEDEEEDNDGDEDNDDEEEDEPELSVVT